jgi:GDP-L-fucose synthase
MKLNSKIFVAGHTGLVGSAIVRKLKEQGYTNIITLPREKLDLTDSIQTKWFFSVYEPEYVFNAAARVGGIYANDNYSAEFINQNLQIQMNLIHNSWEYGVKKFLFMGSVCIYPKFALTPVVEESLLTGHLEPTNESYAIAKIAGIKMCEAYHKQYGFQCLSVMPSNLYGPNDNFNADNGHVIPAMIKKLISATDSVTFWGDGTPYREFLYSDDMAEACIFLMNHEKTGNAELLNIGSGNDISIKDLAEKISKKVNFQGTINWDIERPNGTPKRPLDFSKIKNLGWKPKHSLDEGLQKTIEWFYTNKNNFKDND